jgi:hypothetical protein
MVYLHSVVHVNFWGFGGFGTTIRWTHQRAIDCIRRDRFDAIEKGESIKRKPLRNSTAFRPNHRRGAQPVDGDQVDRKDAQRDAA